MTTDLLERYESTTHGEVRAMAARYMIKNKDIAKYLGVAEMHVSRRMIGKVRWNISEIAALAVLFNCELSDLLPKELPHLDSNQEPSDSLFQKPLTHVIRDWFRPPVRFDRPIFALP